MRAYAPPAVSQLLPGAGTGGGGHGGRASPGGRATAAAGGAERVRGELPADAGGGDGVAGLEPGPAGARGGGGGGRGERTAGPSAAGRARRLQGQEGERAGLGGCSLPVARTAPGEAEDLGFATYKSVFQQSLSFTLPNCRAGIGTLILGSYVKMFQAQCLT